MRPNPHCAPKPPAPPPVCPPLQVRAHPVLLGECLGGALYTQDFVRLCRQVRRRPRCASGPARTWPMHTPCMRLRGLQPRHLCGEVRHLTPHLTAWARCLPVRLPATQRCCRSAFWTRAL